jgi:hypothetical protein
MHTLIRDFIQNYCRACEKTSCAGCDEKANWQSKRNNAEKPRPLFGKSFDAEYVVNEQASVIWLMNSNQEQLQAALDANQHALSMAKGAIGYEDLRVDLAELLKNTGVAQYQMAQAQTANGLIEWTIGRGAENAPTGEGLPSAGLGPLSAAPRQSKQQILSCAYSACSLVPRFRGIGGREVFICTYEIVRKMHDEGKSKEVVLDVLLDFRSALVQGICCAQRQKKWHEAEELCKEALVLNATDCQMI